MTQMKSQSDAFAIMASQVTGLQVAATAVTSSAAFNVNITYPFLKQRT